MLREKMLEVVETVDFLRRDGLAHHGANGTVGGRIDPGVESGGIDRRHHGKDRRAGVELPSLRLGAQPRDREKRNRYERNRAG